MRGRLPRSRNDFTDVSEPITGLDPGVTCHYATCAVDQQPGVGPLCSYDQAFRTISTATRDSVVVTGSAGHRRNQTAAHPAL